MRHENPIMAYRSFQQNMHGQRVEERQRVNGQPLREEPSAITPTTYDSEASAYKPTHGGYPSC
ncbi:hypothetical protein [Bradyrhizobium canariense]|uniref:hypothetical protein n=1 Tax=Bradyrhizobium canariense TaxID=255045 RepID=UPI000A18DF75|nr:hypothetical protein [Bradyrhizobium canariense]OSI37680.1 hypothetical protein BSZ20_38085 [Bradyrhizobium canariense]